MSFFVIVSSGMAATGMPEARLHTLGPSHGNGMKYKYSPLVSFYTGLTPDDSGRFLREIQAWSFDKLESTHYYIQWLFPLPERSGFNVSVPALDAKAIHELQRRPDLQENLRTSFVRILAFFGLALLESTPVRVVPASSWADRSKNWLIQSNHNHLRITRILRSLQLLGLGEEAAAFFRCLEGLYGKESANPHPRISQETFDYWRSAAMA